MGTEDIYQMNCQDGFFVIYYTITLQSVLLGHLSKENNYEELAYETVKLEVTLGQNPYKGMIYRSQLQKGIRCLQ